MYKSARRGALPGKKVGNMKRSLMILSWLATVGAFGLEVKNAQFDNKGEDQIVLDVQYSGCHSHPIRLDVGECGESDPAQVHATLVDETPDACEKFIVEQLSFKMSTFPKLNKCRPAYLRISAPEGKTRTVLIPE